METVKSSAEQRVILHNVSWETYERLLAENADNSAPRFAYDRGELEIMSPNPEHERTNRRIAQLVLAVAEELGITAEDLGSTTFRRADLERGFEPDSCFYIKNEEAIRGKDRIDLAVDPPPDLVIEVDIIGPSLDKLSVCARMGVPEVWRYDAEGLGLDPGWRRLCRTREELCPVAAYERDPLPFHRGGQDARAPGLGS